MWHTPEGDRALDGLEAEVVRAGLESAVHLIEIGIGADGPWEFGIREFDALAPEQQLALLAEVGRALFYRSVQTPRHTSLNEAAIYAIFRALYMAIVFEIDDRSGARMRRLVHEFISSRYSDAVPADDEGDGYAPPDPECNDPEEWEFETECMADGILWDRDFELDDLIVDSSPEKAATLKSYLGIDDDYFTAIAPDPIDLNSVKRTLRRLTQRKPR